jgi:hypothetical protein
MNLMIALFLISLVGGLIVPRLRRRESWAIGGVAAALTILYYVFPTRFM